jgi:hypothetical protein
MNYNTITSLSNQFVFIVNLGSIPNDKNFAGSRWLNGIKQSTAPYGPCNMVTTPPMLNYNVTGTLWLAESVNGNGSPYRFQCLGLPSDSVSLYLTAAHDQTIILDDNPEFTGAHWTINIGQTSKYYPMYPWSEEENATSFTMEFLNVDHNLLLNGKIADSPYGTLELVPPGSDPNAFSGINWLILPAYGQQIANT